MISHKETYFSSFSPQDLFNLIIDIEKYPEFLPWCVKAEILEHPSANVMIAELFIKVASLAEHYTSRVEAIPPIHRHAPCEIKTSLISGPFQALNSTWKLDFNSSSKQTSVEFYIEFAFSSKILQAMLGKIFEHATAKMVNAFEERAHKLYQHLEIQCQKNI